MASLVASSDFMPPSHPNMRYIVNPISVLVQASHLPPRPPTPSFSSPSSRHSSTAPRRESEEEDAQPTTYEIAPLPEQQYSNPKVAEEELHAWAKASCYEMSRTKSDKNKDGIVYKQYYKCANHGKPSNTRKLTEETRVRRRKSRRTGCPMGIVVKAVDPKAPEGPWKIHHQMNGKSVIHNHPPALHASVLSSQRRKVVTDDVQRKNRVPAHHTLAFLPDDVEECLYIRIRDGKRASSTCTRTEALYAKMDALSYYRDAKIGLDDNLDALFYSQPQSLQGYAGNFDLILDNTFRTSKHKVPVCNIIGVTGMNPTIQFGLAFMPTQDEAAYTWVLQQVQNVLTQFNIEAPRIIVTNRQQACIDALNGVFPHIPSLICQWNMNKDVVSYCRRNYPQMHDSETTKYDITDAIYALYFKPVNPIIEQGFQQV